MKIRPVRDELFHADGWKDRPDQANSQCPREGMWGNRNSTNS